MDSGALVRPATRSCLALRRYNALRSVAVAGLGMSYTFSRKCAVRARSAARASRCAAWTVPLCAALACQTPPVDLGDTAESVPELAPVKLPQGAIIDMGSEDAPNHVVDGFSLPERVGQRRASWSEGELSTLAFNLRGDAREYLVTFLAEPYHELGDVPVSVSINKRPLLGTTVTRGWKAYRMVASGSLFNAGRNELSFHFAKTGRPSEFDSRSDDVRDLSVRFEQVQVQPITSSAELSFGSRNAFASAALGEGWERDPSDRGTGTWTLGKRAQLTFHVAKSATPAYQLKLTARTPRGAGSRSVSVSLNGAPLGKLNFSEKRTTAALDVPTERLRIENELMLEFERLEPPSALDPTSKDTRLLGLRVFSAKVVPR